MNLVDSKGQTLEIGSKVVCSVSYTSSTGGSISGSASSRSVKQGKVIGFNKETVQVHFKDGTFKPAIKCRSIVKVNTYNQPVRSNKVLISMGTNIVEADVYGRTSHRLNVEYNGKHFQVSKHKAIKI